MLVPFCSTSGASEPRYHEHQPGLGQEVTNAFTIAGLRTRLRENAEEDRQRVNKYRRAMKTLRKLASE